MSLKEEAQRKIGCGQVGVEGAEFLSARVFPHRVRKGTHRTEDAERMCSYVGERRKRLAKRENALVLGRANRW